MLRSHAICVVPWRPASHFRAAGHKTYTAGDQCDSHPAHDADLFVQSKSRYQGEQNVTQRTSGQHVSEVCPGKGSHIRSKKAEQKEDSHGHPGIGDSQ